MPVTSSDMHSQTERLFDFRDFTWPTHREALGDAVLREFSPGALAACCRERLFAA